MKTVWLDLTVRPPALAVKHMQEATGGGTLVEPSGRSW